MQAVHQRVYKGLAWSYQPIHKFGFASHRARTVLFSAVVLKQTVAIPLKETGARGLKSDNLKLRAVSQPLLDVQEPQPGPPKNVYVYWDLDNKRSEHLFPEEVLDSIKHVASAYGRVAEVNIYGNPWTFAWKPQVDQARRQALKEFMRWEASGSRLDRLDPNTLEILNPEDTDTADVDLGLELMDPVDREFLGLAYQAGVKVQTESTVPGKPHRCGFCGAHFRTLEAAQQHFKSLHEREQKKRSDSPSYQKRLSKGSEQDVSRLQRYKAAQAALLLGAHKGRPGMKTMLEERGARVVPVRSRPQAADNALKHDARILLERLQSGAASGPSGQAGGTVLVLVSDDRGFAPVLRECRRAGISTVAICEYMRNYPSADVTLDWIPLARGAGLDQVLSSAQVSVGETEQERLPSARQTRQAALPGIGQRAAAEPGQERVTSSRGLQQEEREEGEEEDEQEESVQWKPKEPRKMRLIGVRPMAPGEKASHVIKSGRNAGYQVYVLTKEEVEAQGLAPCPKKQVWVRFPKGKLRMQSKERLLPYNGEAYTVVRNKSQSSLTKVRILYDYELPMYGLNPAEYPNQPKGQAPGRRMAGLVRSGPRPRLFSHDHESE